MNRSYLDAIPIETDRLTIRFYEPDQLDKVYAGVSEDREHLAGTMTWNPLAADKDAIREFHEQAKIDSLGGKKLELLIEDKASGAFIGQVGVARFSEDQKEADIGYWIRASCARQGLATEAVRRLCRFLFEAVGVQRITASVLIDNSRSQGVLEKVGFVRMSQKKPCREGVSGESKPAYVYEWRREDWKEEHE